MACLALLAVTGYVAVGILTGQEGAGCAVRATGQAEGAGDAARVPGDSHAAGDGQDYRLKPAQAANAATIAAVASRRGLPERAVTIALATAMQESKLSNIGHGDRDSAGLFQQRPSQGWGTMRQIQDPAYSAARFYEHLVKIPGYSRLPLTVAAQRVQHSGFPQAYAKHEADAALLTSALTGRRTAALTCTTTGGRQDREPGDPARVRGQLAREFGKDVLAEGAGAPTASAPGPIPSRDRNAAASSTPAPSAPASSDRSSSAGRAAAREAGRRHPEAVRLPAPGSRRGWELAHWAVANAARLRIERISYADRVWSAGRSQGGWRATTGDDAEVAPEEGAKTALEANGAQGSAVPGSGGQVELRLASGR